MQMDTKQMNPKQMDTKPLDPKPLDIDLLDPAQTCQQLAVSENQLLSLVNEGRLAAYCLGTELRFRYRDVSALASRDPAARNPAAA